MRDLDTTIDRVTEDVLEKMFFTGILGSGADSYGAEPISALVRFTGPIDGMLAVALDAAAAQAYAANFLGLDSETAPGEQDVMAVAGEFANVLCGATLGQIGGDGTFRISPPDVYFGDEATAVMGQLAACRNYEVPEGNLTVGYSVTEETGRER